MSEKTVLLVVPVFAYVEPKAFGNFVMMALMAGRYATDYKFHVRVPERAILHMAMNEAAQLVVERDYEGMIVFDDDCHPPPDAIQRLLTRAEEGYDFIAGLGLMKNFPHTTTVGKYYPEGVSMVLTDGEPEFRGFAWLDDVSKLPSVPFEADFAGVPIAWMSRRLLSAIEAPWFGTNMDGGEVTHDVYFARKVQAAGFKVWVDPTLPCGHTAIPPVMTFENREWARRWAAAEQRA